MSSIPVADGKYRIRKAGAKSQIANSIFNGKKCHYVQIGIELTGFSSMEDAQEFVEGKGLEADSMSLDFGVKPEPVEEPEDDVASEADDDATAEA